MYGFRDKRLADALAKLPQGPTDTPLIDTDSTAGYDDSWRWPTALEDFITDHLQEESTVINAPAGLSTLGDILIDADPQHKDVYMDDISALSLPTNCADLVLSDPPWKVQSKTQRKRWFDEVVRITKPEGRIIYNAGWIPDHDRVTHLDTRTRVDDDIGSATYLTLYRKDPPAGPVAAETLQRVYQGIASLNQLMAFGGDPDPPLRKKQVYHTLVQPVHRAEQFDADDVDPRIMDPGYERFYCPACSCHRLAPMSLSTHDEILYECRRCGFRAKADEIEPSTNTTPTPEPKAGSSRADTTDTDGGEADGEFSEI